MTLRRPLLAASLLLGLALAPAPAAADISVLGLKNGLVQFLLRQIGTPGAFEVSAGAVTEPAPGVTALNDVSVADANGVWLTVRQISFNWTPSALLDGRVEIADLTIDGMRMTRLSGDPELEGGALAEAPAPEPFSWPRSPIPLKIETFALKNVFLARGVTPQAIAFDATGAVADEGDVQTLTLNVARTDAIAGTIDIAYTRRFDDDALALKLQASEAPGGLVATAAGLPEDSASRVSLTAEGPPSDWRARLTAAADRVFALTGSARVDYEDAIAADIDLTLTPGETLDPAVQRALSPEARLVGRVAEGAGGVVRVEEARLTAADLDLSVSGDYGRRDGAMDFLLSGAARRGLSDLIDGAAFERIGLDGALKGDAERFSLTGKASVDGLQSAAADIGSARLDLTLRREGGRFAATADGRTEAMRLDQLGPEVLGPGTLSLAAAYENDRLTLDRLRIAAASLTLDASGEADLAAEQAALRYRAEARDLTPALKAYGVEGAGALDAEGTLSGPFSALAASGEARGSALVLAGRRLGEARFTHRLTLGETVEGDLAFTLREGELGAVDAKTALRLAAGRLHLSETAAKALGAALTGEAAMDLDSGRIDGRFDLDAPDLAPLGAALDAPLSGAASGRLTLSGARGAQAASLRLETKRLSVDGERFASGPIRADIADLDRGAGLSADLDWRLADRAGPLGTATAKASGDLDALGFEAEARLQADPPITAALAGRLSVAGGETALRLEQGSLALGDDDEKDVFRLAAPATLTARDGVAAIERLSVALPRGGTLEARAPHLGPDGFAAAAEISGFDLALLKDRFDAPVEAGALDAEARIDTRPGKAGGRLSARARRVSASAIGGGGASVDADLVGEWDGRRASATLDIGGETLRERLQAGFSAPLGTDIGGAPVLPKGGAIDGFLRWSGEIAEIWPLVPAPDHLLSGEARVDLTLGGSLESPRISGDVGLRNGRYENLDLGTILTDLTLTSRIEDARRLALDLTGRAGEGRISAQAGIDLGAAGGPRIDASARLSRAMLAQRDDFRAALSGEITAKGKLAAPRIAGALTVDEAELRLIGAGQTDAPDLGPVRKIGRFAPPPEREKPAEEAEGGPRLDLTIAAPRRVFTRGRGLEAEWRADLAATGPLASPRITGRVEKLRGRLDLLGRRFDLTRGVVDFTGGTPIDPRLDVVFAREANDIEGRIEIGGFASDPTLGFASTPPLPQEEVLPRVLFGRAKQSLTAAEAFQLASGLATLLSGEAGVIDRARELTGLDVLDVGETEGGANAVTAGRYVGDGVFVGAKQPLDGTGGSAVIELEVHDGVTVDAEVGRSGGSSVGATWRHDF